MLISGFDQKVALFKKMKAPLITQHDYQPDVIIGAFDDFNVIRVMNVSPIEHPELDLLSNNRWLNLGITVKDDLSGTMPEELIPIINGPVIKNELRMLIYVDVHRELNIKYETIRRLKSDYQMTYSGIGLETLPGYDEFLSMKATDGAMFLRLDPHICMAVYKGLIPYAKGDIITYNIYQGQTDFLAEFTTNKKKKTDPNIITYVRYLYV